MPPNTAFGRGSSTRTVGAPPAIGAFVTVRLLKVSGTPAAYPNSASCACAEYSAGESMVGSRLGVGGSAGKDMMSLPVCR